MGQVRHTRGTMAVLLTAAALLTGLLTGCAANPPVAQSATTTTMTGSTNPALTTTNPPGAVPHKPFDERRGGDRSTAGPADWPPDLPPLAF